jgi:hypothetical protein
MLCTSLESFKEKCDFLYHFDKPDHGGHKYSELKVYGPAEYSADRSAEVY